MEVLKDISEDVDEMFKFTIDTPCNYEDGLMLALDIKVCINEAKNNRIDYEFHGPVFLAHTKQIVINIVGLTALRLAFFMGYE